MWRWVDFSQGSLLLFRLCRSTVLTSLLMSHWSCAWADKSRHTTHLWGSLQMSRKLFFFPSSYNICFLALTYLLPILVIGVCSTHMSLILWWRPVVGVITPQIERARAKKKKVRLVICSRIRTNVFFSYTERLTLWMSYWMSLRNVCLHSRGCKS